MHRVVLPQLFENMEEATIGAWLRSVGETVRAGEPVCELITEKSTFELESPADGTLLHYSAPEKAVVPVNFIIGVLGEPGEMTPDVVAQIEADNAALKEYTPPNAPDETLTPPAPATPSLSVPQSPVESNGAGSRVRATPAARRVARELNVSIDLVALNAPGKVLNEDDVREFAAR